VTICNGYEIDNANFQEGGILVLTCGDDHSFTFQDQEIDIDSDGQALVALLDDDAGEGEVAELEFRVTRPICESDF